MSAEERCPNCGSPWRKGTGLYLCGEGLSGYVAGGCRNPDTGERIRDLHAENESLREAVRKELEYMEGFPEVEDGSPLALVMESLRLALSTEESTS